MQAQTGEARCRREPRVPQGPREPGEAASRPAEPLVGARPVHTLISRFHPPGLRVARFCCFKPPSSWRSVAASPGVARPPPCRWEPWALRAAVAA